MVVVYIVFNVLNGIFTVFAVIPRATAIIVGIVSRNKLYK